MLRAEFWGIVDNYHKEPYGIVLLRPPWNIMRVQGVFMESTSRFRIYTLQHFEVLGFGLNCLSCKNTQKPKEILTPNMLKSSFKDAGPSTTKPFLRLRSCGANDPKPKRPENLLYNKSETGCALDETPKPGSPKP